MRAWGFLRGGRGRARARSAPPGPRGVVAPYKSAAPRRPAAGARRGGAPGAAPRAPPAAPAPSPSAPSAPLNPQPIGAVITGNLYNDDKVLSVAHLFQMHDETVGKHPSL